jgi:hypothetical protein
MPNNVAAREPAETPEPYGARYCRRVARSPTLGPGLAVGQWACDRGIGQQ